VLEGFIIIGGVAMEGGELGLFGGRRGAGMIWSGVRRLYARRVWRRTRFTGSCTGVFPDVPDEMSPTCV